MRSLSSFSKQAWGRKALRAGDGRWKIGDWRLEIGGALVGGLDAFCSAPQDPPSGTWQVPLPANGSLRWGCGDRKVGRVMGWA